MEDLNYSNSKVQLCRRKQKKKRDAQTCVIVVGVRMLDGQATDVLEGSSLSFQSEYIDIYSNCWGPKDDGKTFGKPGKLAQEALMQGALKVKLRV